MKPLVNIFITHSSLYLLLQFISIALTQQYFFKQSYPLCRSPCANHPLYNQHSKTEARRRIQQGERSRRQTFWRRLPTTWTLGAEGSFAGHRFTFSVSLAQQRVWVVNTQLMLTTPCYTTKHTQSTSLMQGYNPKHTI